MNTRDAVTSSRYVLALLACVTASGGCMVGGPEEDEVFVEEIPDSEAEALTIAYSTANLVPDPRHEHGQIRGWGNVRYEVSAYTRWRGGGEPTHLQFVQMQYYDRDGQVIGNSPRIGMHSSAWVKIVLRFTPPAGTYLMTVMAGDLSRSSDICTSEWDDAGLYET